MLHLPTMEGPTSTCASARKAGRYITGYGRHSPAPNLVSALSWLGGSVGESMPLIATVVTRQRRVFARKVGLRLTGTRRPTGLVRPSLHVNLRYPGPMFTVGPVRR
jgi:hypothetical protein